MNRYCLSKIFADNFRSLVDFSIDIPEGITIVSGENGTGKSSIVYAIQYALFGRVGKSTKKDLSSWVTGEDPKVVISMYDTHGNTFDIARYKSLVFKYNGKRESVRDHKLFQELVHGLKYSFVTTDFVTFVDMKPAQRREALVELIDELGILRGPVIDSIGNIYSNTSMKILDTEKKINELNGAIKELHDSIILMERSVRLAESSKDELEERIVELESDIKKVKEELDNIDYEYEAGLKEKLKSIKAEIESCKDEIAMLRKEDDEYKRLVTLVKGLKDKLERINTVIHDAESSIKEMRCKWCGSRIGMEEAQRIDTKAEVYKNEKKKLEKQISAYISKIKKYSPATEKIKELENKLNDLESEKESILRDIGYVSSLRSKLESLKSSLESTKKALDSVNDVLKDKAEIAKRKRRLTKLNKQLKLLERRKKILDALKEKLDKSRYFIKKDAVDIYVSNVCSTLENVANSILSSTDHCVEITPNKGAIDIKVDGTKFHLKSAGERQRVRIAVSLAFTALASSSGFVIIDEVLDSNLDQDGLSFLAGTINTWLRDRFLQVIIMSHRPEFIDLLSGAHNISLRKEGGVTIVK